MCIFPQGPFFKEKKQFSQKKRVLDLCCGTGWTANELANVAKVVKAVDYSKVSIEKAKKEFQNDLRKTLDNEIVTFHDRDLKRLFNINLEVENLTFAEINKFFSAKNCKLLTLKEALINFPQTKFNIDLKSKEVIKETIKIVKELKAFERVWCPSSCGRIWLQCGRNFTKVKTSHYRKVCFEGANTCWR